SLRCSRTRRTARSRTSGENLLGFLFMAPFSQELEPPQNSGRFTNSSEKLSKLHQRVLRIKDGFAAQRLGNVQVNGVLITKHGDAEIEPFIEEAERFGLGIVGLSALTRLADGLRFKIQPDALYDELFSSTQRSADLFDQVGAGTTAVPSSAF
ncbi:hypothetical protein QZM82_36690, partial [Burkholderia cepacia]|uniref:hypothetical protein n=1 Tax=Burkholderia cepacia TaxID=292 RepID=UPI002653D437